MEVRFALSNPKPDRAQDELLEAARLAAIHTFGWPIGIVLTNRDEDRPHPRADGIVAEIAVTDRSSYDYWALRRNGDFFLLASLFEDERKPGSIFFNVRIMRITETLLYCARLYQRLRITNNTEVHIRIAHVGLRDRVLIAAGERLIHNDYRNTTEDESHAEIQIPITKVETDLVELVKQFAEPLFLLFDFCKFDHSIYEDIVNNFVKGKVT